MFWENQRVVVTGGAGFLGSYVLDVLREHGVKEPIVPRSATCDLRVRENCHRIVQGADIVIHLAAKVGGIRFNQEHPAEMVFDNVIMGAHLLEEARLANVKKFVIVGTVCAYPKFTPIPFKEEDLWGGYPEETNAPYGLAKKMLLVQSQAYRKQYGFNSIFLLPTNLYGPCFSGDTDVMTTRGIENIKEINIGDIVYTLNPETYEVEEAKVTALQKTWSSEMFSFRSKSVDFRVTPDHKIFYRTSTKFVRRPAEFFRSRVGKQYGQISFAFHNYKKGGSSPEFIDLSEYVDKAQLQLESGYVKDFTGSAGHHSKLYPVKYKSIDFAGFLGWYISEGSISQTSPNAYQIKVTQCSNQGYRIEIEQLLTSMGIPFGKDNRSFYFASRTWKNFIERHIGKGAGNKRIPNFVFRWHPNLLRVMFNTMMKGDGSGDRKYTTKSKGLMLDFLHLAFLCGIKVGTVRQDPGGYWRISLRRHKKSTTVKYQNISIEKTEEAVYCLTTDKNHIVYTGRNLKFNWIGQCDNFDPASSHAIPALIKKILDAKKNSDKEVIIWGTGKATRDFLFVEDAAEGIILATVRYNKGDPVNLGSGAEVSIKDLVKLIIELSGFEGEIIWDTTKLEGQPRRCLDTSRAKREFGFEARTELREGLRKTIDWILK